MHIKPDAPRDPGPGLAGSGVSTGPRQLTRRGVLWLGLKCDVRCKFCYDENLAPADKRWISLDDAKAALHRFRYVYQNRFVDFMGGEPTLHPHLDEIVAYSASIGLAPTCITHALHLADPGRVRRLKDAGIHDFLVSVHGLGESVDRIHGVGRGNADRQRKALQNLRDAGIPIRFNVTMIEDNREQLPAIALLCDEVGGRVINFLTFNPYFEWKQRDAIPFQARHEHIVPFLKCAIDICTARGIEANVRYMPICLMRGYERHVYTGFQLPYDPHEWDYNSWYDRRHVGRPDLAWYRTASETQRARHNYEYADACAECAVRPICDGFHAQYLRRWGGGEALAYEGEPVTDPTHFIADQRKVSYLLDDDGDGGNASADQRAPGLDAKPRPPLRSLPLTQFQPANGHRAGVRPDLVAPTA